MHNSTRSILRTRRRFVYRYRSILPVSFSFSPSGGHSGSWQSHAVLALILAVAIFIRRFTNLVALKEQHLRAAFAGIDPGRQRRGIGELQRNIAFPLRLERCDVDDDAATRVGRFAETDRQYVAWNAEVLHRARQRERIRRNDADIALEIDEGFFIEIFWIDDGRIDIGENLEFIGTANIVAIRRRTVRHDFPAVGLAHLARLERLDHALLLRHTAYPFIGFDGHCLGGNRVRL